MNVHPDNVYDRSPYPRYPLEATPFNDWNALFLSNVSTARYRRDGFFRMMSGGTILDVGCGSGWKTLILAKANPDCEVIAIDPSGPSIELAQLRIEQHRISNVRFHVAGLNEVPRLVGTFDYINCDELIYLLPDIAPTDALSLLRSALTRGGILRFNLHSRYQREGYYRGQQLFRLLGLMDCGTGPSEASAVSRFFGCLKPDTELKRKTWIPLFESSNAEEHILMNFLLQDDRGYTIPEFFEALERAHFRFISMVNWDQWRLERLFTDSIPALIMKTLKGQEPDRALQLFELLNPIHRRLDAWVGRVEDVSETSAELEIDEDDQLCIHPVFKSTPIRTAMELAIQQGTPFKFTDFVKVSSAEPLEIPTEFLQNFLPLWDRPCLFRELANGRSDELHGLLIKLEAACFLMKKRPD